MAKLTVISIACALAALGAGAFVLRGKPMAASVKAAPSAASEHELRAEIERLRGEVRGVSAAQRLDRAALVHAAANTPPGQAAQEPENVPASERTPLDPKQFMQERERATHEAVATIGNRLDDVLNTDVVDARWRAEVTRNVDAIFTDIPNSTVVSTDCGSRLCRVVVERTSVDELRDLPKSFSNRPPFDSEILYRYDTEAKPPRVTMYVTREGNSIAALGKPQL